MFRTGRSVRVRWILSTPVEGAAASLLCKLPSASCISRFTLKEALNTAASRPQGSDANKALGTCDTDEQFFELPQFSAVARHQGKKPLPCCYTSPSAVPKPFPMAASFWEDHLETLIEDIFLRTILLRVDT